MIILVYTVVIGVIMKILTNLLYKVSVMPLDH